MLPFVGSLFFFVVLVGLVLLANAVRIVREYERLVVFRLGRMVGERVEVTAVHGLRLRVRRARRGGG